MNSIIKFNLNVFFFNKLFSRSEFLGECLKTLTLSFRQAVSNHSTSGVEWFDRGRRMVRQRASNGSTGGVEWFDGRRRAIHSPKMVFHCLFLDFSLFLLCSVPFSTVQYRSVPFSTVQYVRYWTRCFWGASIQHRSAPFSTWGAERGVFDVFLRSFNSAPFSTVQHVRCWTMCFLRCFGSFEVQIPPRGRMH